MSASPRDLALWLDVYERLMAAYHAGPVGGVARATDPAEAILAKAMEYRALILQCHRAGVREPRGVNRAVARCPTARNAERPSPGLRGTRREQPGNV